MKSCVYLVQPYKQKSCWYMNKEALKNRLWIVSDYYRNQLRGSWDKRNQLLKIFVQTQNPFGSACLGSSKSTIGYLICTVAQLKDDACNSFFASVFVNENMSALLDFQVHILSPVSVTPKPQ